MSHVTRRSLLSNAAGFATAAMLPAAGVAATFGPDPVFALIEEHRQAYAAVTNEVLDLDAWHEVLERLRASTPATLAGMLAVLRHAQDLADDEDFPLFPADGNDVPRTLMAWAERAITALGAVSV